ncbi:MAG: HDOD domain-containing protein [Gammaproteobacteria bacterium]|nr:HDOD domain-containing protein [Gammaproteobacteria bacterium]
MPEFFIGRQPILDRNLKLHAYELLFRSGEKNDSSGSLDDDSATSQVLITAFTEIGLEKLVGNRLAFVNLPYKFICNPDLLPMSPEQVVLEVLETVTIDQHSVEGIKKLAELGFTIALDDFIYSSEYDAVLPYISLIKLDITQIERDKWAEQISALRQYGCQILAEKVETEEDFQALKALEVDYYQGYFFAKPKIISGKRISSNKLMLLQTLAKINDPNTDIDVLQDLISKDVGISVKSLNYVNSAASGLNRKVESIREAILYLGRQTIRSWVTLFVMASVDDKPDELMSMALVRAKFCELVARVAELEGKDSYFTVGLFSILDSLLDAPLEEVIESMALTGEMRDALVSHTGDKGLALRCAMDLEYGFADGLSFRDLDELTISDLHLEAMRWADVSMQELGLS